MEKLLKMLAMKQDHIEKGEPFSRSLVNRRSHTEMFFAKSVLENFQFFLVIIIAKHVCLF